MAASSLVALTYGAPIARRSLVERATAQAYSVFGGDGSTTAGWPSQKQWQSFDDLWAVNVGTIGISCTQFGQPNNSDEETAAIKSAIQSTASSSGVPAQFILAVMMQESKGCVRVPTTNYGVRNPGLMQDHDGTATCNEGSVQNPCPSSTITKMIEEGAGVGNTFGLSQVVASASTYSDAQKYYRAARSYNSGSVDGSGNLGAGIATHCYASDIANRLVGWNGENTQCSETAIGSMTGGSAYAGNEGNDSTPPETPTTTTPQPTATSAAASIPKPSATKTPTTGNNNGNTNSNIKSSATNAAPGANTSACKGWYSVVDGDTCESVTTKTGASFSNLQKLNSQLDANCSNLWKGYDYCVV
ncbi:hypothetical protein BDV96DRAFT_648259 [Lophiotrema nucula]|uniref:LysM domain-containing protein n=1 Tax=Lophiotrema nucula TaxID=690887 RepID=A0A6A5Z4P8_9PLEO|nr:hypothetical protein BDV96DRAFT_648259 [Lophiotrema nucula]